MQNGSKKTCSKCSLQSILHPDSRSVAYTYMKKTIDDCPENCSETKSTFLLLRELNFVNDKHL